VSPFVSPDPVGARATATHGLPGKQGATAVSGEVVQTLVWLAIVVVVSSAVLSVVAWFLWR
jgi:hypothetical protein